MPIRLIALDLDDTLLDRELRIPPENVSAIRAALDAGVVVILASGRTIQSMRPYARQAGLAGMGYPIIAMNGAEIRDFDSDTVIRSCFLSREACERVAELASGMNVPFQTYLDDGILVSRPNEWTEIDSRLSGLPNRVFADTEEVFRRGNPKLLVPAPPERIAEIFPEFAERLEGLAKVIISKPYFMEILPPGCNKGTALAWVAELLGVERRDTMAIGDAMNDLEMVSWAGYGCAPANAIPSVLAASTHASGLNHEEGAVADLIWRIALGKTGFED